MFNIGGRLIRHARYLVLPAAESHLTRSAFWQNLGRTEPLTRCSARKGAKSCRELIV
jgi:hypothetical protein